MPDDQDQMANAPGTGSKPFQMAQRNPIGHFAGCRPEAADSELVMPFENSPVGSNHRALLLQAFSGQIKDRRPSPMSLPKPSYETSHISSWYQEPLWMTPTADRIPRCAFDAVAWRPFSNAKPLQHQRSRPARGSYRRQMSIAASTADSGSAQE